MEVLKLFVLVSLFFSLISLLYITISTARFPKPPSYSSPRASIHGGIAYALGKGMLPTHKESARNHLPSYAAGILYHIGLFTALLVLILFILSAPPPSPLLWVFRIVIGAGLAAGLGLFVKRIVSNKLRFISCPDDYIANALVDIFMAATLLLLFRLVPAAVLWLASIILFLYMPLGKIRHCVLFFYTRILFGIFLGRRGVIPPRKQAEG